MLAGLSAWNLKHAGEHFGVNRDPGVYSVSAVGLAEQGDLLFEVDESPFTAAEGLSTKGAGFYDRRSGQDLEAQFSHLTAVLLAIAYWLGDLRLLVSLNSLISGLAGLLLFGMLRRWASPWASLIGTGVVAFSLPFAYVARDAFSEPASLVIVLSAVVQLSRMAAGLKSDIAGWVLGGLLAGSLLIARIDGVVLLPSLLAMLAVLAIRRPELPYSHISAAAGGALVAGAIGMTDLRLRGGRYLDDLWPQTHMALILLGAVVLVAPLVVAVWPRIPFRDRVRVVHERWTHLVGTIAVGFVLFTWLARPSLYSAIGSFDNNLIRGLQAREGLESEPTRTYAESTLTWLSWYLGPVVLLLAALGAGLSSLQVLRDRLSALLVPLFLLGGLTLLYLYRPSISPDQLWATRRFVPQGLPFVALLLAIALDRILDGIPRPTGQWPPKVLLAFSTLLVPVLSWIPLRAVHTDRMTISAIKTICHQTSEGQPVLILDDELGPQLVQTVQLVCGVPSAFTSADSAASLAGLAAAWADEDRELLVLSGPAVDLSSVADLRLSISDPAQVLERTVERPPEEIHFSSIELRLWSVRL
ncbi:MAG: hypothetical protein GY745_09995 [Actinomycetia bacterium]|nr:hypothetical protein [Actinomycetes bacterium]